jgi:beta-glucosidase
VSVRFTVRNTGARAGADTPQVYVSAPATAGWEAPKRLAGFEKLQLAPGASRTVAVAVDPRWLSTWDVAAHGWRRPAGTYTVAVGASSRAVKLTAPAALDAWTGRP